MQRIGSVCLLLVASLTAYAIAIVVDDRPLNSPPSKIWSRPINKVEISRFLQKYEELKWYPVKGEVASLLHEMPSEVFMGHHVPQFDRTILALHTLGIILDGKYDDYLEFVGEQEKENRLTWDQFQDLQGDARGAIVLYRGLSPGQVREVLEYVIILHEIAESTILQKKGWIYEITPHNDQGFVKEVLRKHPNIFPTFAKITLEQQRLVQEMYGLFNLQNMLQLQDIQGIFASIKKQNFLNNDPGLFELAFLVEEAVFAGARGDFSSYGSITLTKHAAQNLQTLRQAIILLRDSNEREAYKYYLSRRSDWLGYDPGSPLNRVLTRFGAMMDLFTPIDGKILKESFLRLQPEELSLIIGEFDEMQATSQSKKFTYLNQLLQNLSENRKLGACHKEKLAATINIGFPFIAKVLQHLSDVDHQDIPFEIDFSLVAQIAIADPTSLASKNIDISKSGKVTLH